MKKQFIRQWTLLLLFALAITPAALAQKPVRASARECTCHTLPPARQSALPESFSTDSTGGDAQGGLFGISTVTRTDFS